MMIPSGMRLRISVFDLPPGKETAAPGPSARCFVYAPEGRVSLASGGAVRDLQADEGAFADPGTPIRAQAPTWIFEVAPADLPFPEGAEIIRSQTVRPSVGPPFLIRADRIESPPGAATPRHGHRGPGMRRLIKGCLLAEIGDTLERLEAGQAWFETGADMVVGTNIGLSDAAFVRVLMLPPELEGGLSSYVPANEAEATKPRLVRQRMFGETRLGEVVG